MKTYVEIHAPGCAAARHELEVGPTTIGMGPSAAIRVPASAGFASELLELTVGETGVRVCIPSDAPGTLVFEGSEERQVHAPFGSDVFFGNARLAFLKESGRRKKSPLLLLLAPVVLFLAGVEAYSAGPNQVSKADVAAPVLFDDSVPKSCPESEPGLAERRARDSDRAAIAKQQRSAFELSDGIDAVSLWQTAEACYQAAGKGDDAARTLRQRLDWTGQLTERYASLRMQLRAALDAADPREALSAVCDLQTLLARQAPGPYHQWLGQLRQSLEQQVARLNS